MSSSSGDSSGAQQDAPNLAQETNDQDGTALSFEVSSLDQMTGIFLPCFVKTKERAYELLGGNEVVEDAVTKRLEDCSSRK